MQILKLMFYCGVMPVGFWATGAADKYPELFFPFFLLWCGSMSSMFSPGELRYDSYRRRELEKMRKVALEHEEENKWDLVYSIDSYIQEFDEEVEPLKVAPFKRLLKLYPEDRISRRDIERRIEQLKERETLGKKII